MPNSQTLTEAQLDVEQQYGVPVDWLLGTMYNVLDRSTYSIGKTLGYSAETVRVWMEQFDIPRLDRGKSKKRGKSWREQQVEERFGVSVENLLDILYVQLRRGTRRVAEDIGISQKAVCDWLERYEFEIRDVGSPQGQSHPRWNGGCGLTDALRKLLGDDSWSDIRESVLGSECYQCGEENVKLHAHHIIPLRAGGTNGDWNFMTLCTSCHTTVEHATERIVTPMEGGDF